jgi:hypothetical protein
VSGRAKINAKLSLDGAAVPSETTYVWAGPYVLSVHTVIPRPDLAIELHSTFTGHPGTPTVVAHLVLGPPGHPAALSCDERPREDLLVGDGCVCEHAMRLVELLRGLGREPSVALPQTERLSA